MEDLQHRWRDISVALTPELPVWPGDPAFERTRSLDIDRGDECNVSVLRLCAHTGTHMDAPEHYLGGAPTIDEMPLEATVGVARVIDLGEAPSVTPDVLHAHEIRSGERVLFKTTNSAKDWSKSPFLTDFVSIRADAARYLADVGVRTVGIDYLSVGAFEGDGTETHRVLLAAGIWVVEGLDLRGVEPGFYDLVCLPIKVMGAEGAPARAIIRKRTEEPSTGLRTLPD